MRLGDKGPEILALRKALINLGYEAASQNFGTDLEDAAKHFQTQHQDENGKWLVVDGIVGPKTLWSIENPNAEPKPSNAKVSIPAFLSDERYTVLQTALSQVGVYEKPLGSNRGPSVDQYLPDWQKTTQMGPPWCCYFVSWVIREALGNYPLGERFGSVTRLYNEAFASEYRLTDTPRPGDVFLIRYWNNTPGRVGLTGKGHTGFVLRVSENGLWFNTIEGNSGHMVRIGTRPVQDSDEYKIAFMSPLPSDRDTQPDNWQRGIVDTKQLPSQTR